MEEQLNNFFEEAINKTTSKIYKKTKLREKFDIKNLTNVSLASLLIFNKNLSLIASVIFYHHDCHDLRLSIF